jgi:hypothetical protein
MKILFTTKTAVTISSHHLTKAGYEILNERGEEKGARVISDDFINHLHTQEPKFPIITQYLSIYPFELNTMTLNRFIKGCIELRKTHPGALGWIALFQQELVEPSKEELPPDRPTRRLKLKASETNLLRARGLEQPQRATTIASASLDELVPSLTSAAFRAAMRDATTRAWYTIEETNAGTWTRNSGLASAETISYPTSINPTENGE